MQIHIRGVCRVLERMLSQGKLGEENANVPKNCLKGGFQPLQEEKYPKNVITSKKQVSGPKRGFRYTFWPKGF